jgi:hypothetical protein
MSDVAALETTLTAAPDGNESSVNEYIENASRTDGSRTPIWKIARCHQLNRDGRSLTSIGQILGMDNRTVRAVLDRGDHLIADARMLLKANALGFAGDLIQASQEAAKRGKTEGIAAILDRLDVTQPPKSQNTTQVAVQVNLHGGPDPVSLAKVSMESEGLENQAGKNEGLISQLTDTAANSPQVPQADGVTAVGSPQHNTASHRTDISQSGPATFVADREKQA